LKLAIDAAISLLKPRGIPGQVEVNEIVAPCLKVQALPRGIGANENANRFLLKRSIERDLDAISFNETSLPSKDKDTPVQINLVTAALEKTFLQPFHEPTTCIVPFGKQDQPPFSPCKGVIQHLGLDPIEDGFNARVGQIARRAGNTKHLVDMSDGYIQVAKFGTRLIGYNVNKIIVVCQFRCCFNFQTTCLIPTLS